MLFYNIIQSEDKKIHNAYKELVQEYFSLKNEAEEIFNYTANNTKLYDELVFSKHPDTFFVKYKKDKKRQILSKLSASYNLKEENIIKLFNIKKKKFIRHKEYLSEDTLGTVINMLSEFYENVYRDLERNSNKGNEFISPNNHELKALEYPFSIENVKKKTIQYTFRNEVR